jgi:hypothetical protein
LPGQVGVGVGAGLGGRHGLPTLFFAGPPDIFASDDPTGAWEGTRGGAFLAVSAREGTTLAQYDLDSLPVFDGMAAAHGRLYLATMDGPIVCFHD